MFYLFVKSGIRSELPKKITVKTFDYMVKKSLYDMLFSLLGGQLGQQKKLFLKSLLKKIKI